MPQLSFHTPLGPLTVSEADGAIVALDWGWGRDQEETVLLLAAREQVQDYFDGERGDFNLPLTLSGSPLAQQVLRAVQLVRCGQTVTYADIARQVPGNVSMVGRVLTSNPLPILVPSHRVLAKAGLGPYPDEGGGRSAKRLLLALEARWVEVG